MRRIIAHIALAASMLVGVGVTANATLTQVTSDNTYSSGKTITYRLKEIDDGKSLEENQDAASEIAKVMKERLVNWGVTSYDIRILGNDTIETTFNAANDTEYSDISRYLRLSSQGFSLSSSDDKISFDGEEMFDSDMKASIVYNQYAPIVLIPVNNGEKLKEAVEGYSSGDSGVDEKLTPNYALSSGDDEGESALSLYLWSHRGEADTFAKAQSNPYVAEKIITNIGTTNLFYEDECKNIQIICGSTTEDGNSYDTSKVDEAYYTAKKLVNMINASSYEFEVTELYSVVAKPLVEDLVSLNEHNRTLAVSLTLISALIAVIFVVVGTFIMYRLGAFTIGLNLLTTVYLSTLILILFGSAFNLGAFIGLALVGALSVFGGVTYLSRLKKEIEKGKSIKKANQEASNKNTMLVVDSSIVTVILGLFLFLMGGSSISSMGVVLIFGGVISLVLNLLITKLMMYFLTNSRKLSEKAKLFGAYLKDNEPKLEEEKSEELSLDKVATKEKTKKRSLAYKIGLGVLATAGVVMSIVFASLNGNALAMNETKLNAKLYVEVNDTTSEIVDAKYLQDNILDNVFIGDHYNADKANKLTNYISELNHEEKTFYNVDTEDYSLEYDYYVIDFKQNLDLTNEVAFYKTGENTYSDNGRLQDILETYINTFEGIPNGTVTVSFKTQSQITSDVVSMNVLYATLIALGVSLVYLTIRYRLSRALGIIVSSAVAGTLAFFIPVITRFPVSSLVITASAFVALVTLLAGIIIANKDREYRVENKIKLKDYTDEERAEQFDGVMLESNNAYKFYLLVVGMGLIPLFGFAPSVYSVTLILILIGIVAGMFAISAFNRDISLAVETLFVKIRRSIKPRKNKKQTKKTTSEPEEAPILGINI